MRPSFLPRRSDPAVLSVAVLGVGNIGSVHLGSAQAMDGVDVVAAADAVPANRAHAEAAGVDRTYDDYATLLDQEELDAAIVALPPFLHRDAVERAADAEVDVFVEKPFARSVDEADAMLETAREAGIAVGVDHTIRYQPDMRGVKREYEEGSVGHIPYAMLSRINDGPLGRPPVGDAPPEWQLDPDAAGGGALMELGVHLFDVLRWLFDDVEVLDAATDATLETPAEDAATVLCRSPSTGTTITLHCGSYQWEELPDVNVVLRLEGIAGTIENESYLPDNFYADAARSAATNVARRLTGDEPEVYGPTFFLRAHYDALADFVAAVRNGESPPVDGEDGRRCVELVERAYELAEEGSIDEEAAPEVTT